MNYEYEDKHVAFTVQLQDIRALGVGKGETPHQYFVEPCVGRWHLLLVADREILVFTMQDNAQIGLVRVDKATPLYEICHLPFGVLRFLTEIMNGWRA